MADIEIVAIRDADGSLRIGREPAAPAGRVRLCLTGLDLLVDPTDPDGPPCLTVWDRSSAGPALVEMIGSEASRAVLALERGERAGVVVHRGELGDGIVRVGLLRWLGASSPDPLTDEVVGVEAALTTLEVGDVMDLDIVEQAREELLAAGPTVARWSSRARERGAPAFWAAFVGQAVSAALAEHDMRNPDGPVAADLRHEDELADAIGEDLGPRAPDDLSGLADRRLPVAQHAGAPQAGPRTASVDWWQVPRGLLDPGEDTVEWAVLDRAITVRARAARGAVPTGRLGFRVYRRGAPLPVAWGALRLEGDRWEGAAHLVAAADAAEIEIDIIDVIDTRRPRLGRSARTARAERWAARGVTALRLGSADDARGALEESARLYRALAGEDPVARRCEARVSAVLRSALIHQGQERMARAVGRAWRSPQPPVGEEDVVLPDLDAVGWHATVSEQLLLEGGMP